MTTRAFFVIIKSWKQVNFKTIRKGLANGTNKRRNAFVENHAGACCLVPLGVQPSGHPSAFLPMLGYLWLNLIPCGSQPDLCLVPTT